MNTDVDKSHLPIDPKNIRSRHEFHRTPDGQLTRVRVTIHDHEAELRQRTPAQAVTIWFRRRFKRFTQ